MQFFRYGFDFLDFGERKFIRDAFSPIFLAVARDDAVIMETDFAQPFMIIGALFEIFSLHPRFYEPLLVERPPKPERGLETLLLRELVDERDVMV